VVEDPDRLRHLLCRRRPLVVVDGYNLGRAAWPGLAPEEERRRVVALLEDLRARTGAEAVVVFDGVSGTVAPSASRSVRVRFSVDGASADDEVAALVAAVPVRRAVVVVSSDREVADHAVGLGAHAVRSATFLAAVGR